MVEELFKGTYVKLIEDTKTMKEAFIFDELQSYMDLSNPSNPQWITPIKLRLQEKKDWEDKLKSAIEKLANHGEGCRCPVRFNESAKLSLLREMNIND